MKSFIENIYNYGFHAKSQEEEWNIWHQRTVNALTKIRNSETSPKELSDSSELKYYQWLSQDILTLLGEQKANIEDILELGCGSAALSANLLSDIQANAYLLDNEKIALEYAQIVLQHTERPISCLHADADKIPLPNDSIDFVHSVGLIEHFNDEKIQKILCEVRRVLRKNRTFFLAVPNFFSPDLISIWRKYGKGSERYLSKKNLASFVKKSDMEIITAGHTSYVLDKSVSGWLPTFIEKFVGKQGLGFLNYVFAKKK